MNKDNVVLINFRIREKTRESLIQSPIHKSPLYLDEYQEYLKKKEEEKIKYKMLMIGAEKINPNKFHPKSRNLISKFKNNENI